MSVAQAKSAPYAFARKRAKTTETEGAQDVHTQM